MRKHENEEQNRTIFEKDRRRGGFTMAELLMTVAILTILSALVFVGILQIVNHMKMMEMNQTAKQIFIAAQNHLTQMKAGGKLTIELAKAEDSRTADTAKSWFGQEIHNIQLSDDTQNSSENGKNNRADDSEATQYYAVDQTGLSGGEGKGSGILSGMLPFGSIDETVRTGGSWIIQYEASTGTVQGVFYTDGSHGLFGKSSAKLTAAADQENLQNAVRNGASDNYGEAIRMRYVPKQTGNTDKVIVGYYGGAEAKKLVLKKIKAPVVEIDNTNYLKVKVYDPNSTKLDDPKVKLTLEVHGQTSGQTVYIDLNSDTDQKNTRADYIKTSDVLRFKSESVNTVQVVDSEGKAVEGEKITGAHLVYTLVFDDITKEGGHFAQIFGKKGFLPGEDITVTALAQGNNTELKESQPKTQNSLFESVSDDPSSKETPSSGNSNASGSSTKYLQANISNTRNLENLDPKISGLPRIDPEKKTGETRNSEENKQPVFVIRKAVQTADIAWEYDETTGEPKQIASKETDTKVFGSTLGARELREGATGMGFVNEVRAFRKAEEGFQKNIPTTDSRNSLSDIMITKVRSGDYDTTPQKNSYYGIRNDQLQEYDGQNYIIANMVIRDVANTETAYNGRIVKSEADAGLFRGLYQGITIHNLILKNFDVKATDGDAGTLAGTISSSEKVTINHVVSYGTEGEVSAEGHEKTVNRNAGEVYYPVGGGLIGSWKGNGTVSDCAASVSVAGVVSGGLIGDVEDQNGSIEIRNSYSGGMIDKDKQKYSTGTFNVTARSNGRGVDERYSNYYRMYVRHFYAGGLLGHVSFQDGNSVIQDCYSTCSVGSSDEKGVRKEIFVRGGLIGYLTNEGANGIKSSVKNSYAGGYVAPAENNDKAGAFIGFINAWYDDVLIGDMYLPDINGDMPAISGSIGFSHGDFIEKAVPEATQSRSVKTVYYNQRRTTYPFRTVTDAGERAVELERKAVGQGLSETTSAGVHFGDWVKPKKLASRYYLAYREGNRWFVYDPISQKEVSLETEKTEKKLENNKVIDDSTPKYGVLVLHGEEPVLYIWNGSWQSKNYNGWTLGKLKDERDQDAIEIDGQEYDYFDFDIDQESGTGLIVTDGNGDHAVNVETCFAAAFWPHDYEKGRYDNQRKLGSDSNDPIIIRTKKQQKCIVDYPHRYYKQTTQINK